MNILGNNRHRIRRDDIVYSGSYSGYFTGGLDYNFNLNTPINGFYLQTPYTSDLDLSTGDIVIEARFNATSFSHGMAILAKDTYGSNFDWGLLIENSTTLRFSTAMKAQNLYATVPTMNTGQWYHFKFERISGVNTIYLDGVAYGSNTISITNMSTISLTVGTTSYNNPGYHFEGYVDNIHISKNGIDVIDLDFETLNSSDQFVDNTGRLWTIHPEPYVNLITECVDIVRDGLLVYLDSMNIRSYDRITSNWSNLVNPGTHDATLYGGYVHSTDGGIQFDGTTGRAIYNMDFTQAFTVMTIAKSNAPLWDDAGVITSARYNNGFVLHPFASSTQYASTIFSSSMGASNDIFTPSNIENVALYGTSSNGSNLNYGYYNDELHIISAPTSRTNGTNGDVYIGGDSPPYDTRFGNVTIYAHLYYNRQLSHAEVKQNYKALRSHFL
jgi:hypothetical protein